MTNLKNVKHSLSFQQNLEFQELDSQKVSFITNGSSERIDFLFKLFLFNMCSYLLHSEAFSHP